LRRTPRTASIGLALVAASSLGCATYHPRASRFISRDADGIYHRDGQAFDVGMFGGSAESLVSGDAHAVDYARRYKHLNHVGLPFYLVGIATMLVAPFVLAPAAPEGARTPVAFGVIGLGAGISLVGMTFIFKGDAALVDAVNVYNDDVAAAARGGTP
jgi:hypothetical protein